jgi:hypothetical protein
MFFVAAICLFALLGAELFSKDGIIDPGAAGNCRRKTSGIFRHSMGANSLYSPDYPD